MRIRMVQQMSGSRPDGRIWPGVGEELDVSDAEGMELCRAFDSHSHPIAVPVPAVEARKVERPEPPPDPRIETRSAPDEARNETGPAKDDDEDKPDIEMPVRRGPGRPRKIT